MCMRPFNLDEVDSDRYTAFWTQSLFVDFLQLLLQISLLIVCD